MDAIHKNVSKTASNCTSSFLAQEEEFLEVFRAINKKGKNQIERLFKLLSDYQFSGSKSRNSRK